MVYRNYWKFLDKSMESQKIIAATTSWHNNGGSNWSQVPWRKLKNCLVSGYLICEGFPTNPQFPEVFTHPLHRISLYIININQSR